MSRTSKHDQVEARRAKVAMLLDAVYTQREIAEQCKVSPATVNKDMKALRKRWTEEQLVGVHDMMVDDLHRIVSALQAIWPAVISGNPIAIDRAIKLIEVRARLLDYAPPQRVDVTSGGKPMSFVTRVVAHVPQTVTPAEDEAGGK